jgi:mitogen-activated protein kinase kinase
VKKQILRELNFNKDCASEHICQYYGAFMDKSSSTISIAMEFCEGGSLDSVYREVKRLGGRTGEKVLGKVAEGVLHGLTYLNSKKIIHRGTQFFNHPESQEAKHSSRHKALEHFALP